MHGDFDFLKTSPFLTRLRRKCGTKRFLQKVNLPEILPGRLTLLLLRQVNISMVVMPDLISLPRTRSGGIPSWIPAAVYPREGGGGNDSIGIFCCRSNITRIQTLYIDLSEKPSAESREISEGVVLDYDADGHLVGIDIDNASTKVQLKELSLQKLPSDIKAVA